MLPSVTKDAAPRQAAGLETHFVDDQFVVFEKSSDRLHCLNPTAALVFELCDGDHPVSTIIELVRDAYDLPESPADEVMTCIANLYEIGIIH